MSIFYHLFVIPENIRISVDPFTGPVDRIGYKCLMGYKLTYGCGKISGSNGSNWTGDIVGTNRDIIEFCEIGYFFCFQKSSGHGHVNLNHIETLVYNKWAE